MPDIGEGEEGNKLHCHVFNLSSHWLPPRYKRSKTDHRQSYTSMTVSIRIYIIGRVQRLTTVIPVLWEAKVGGLLKAGVRDQPGKHGKTRLY
ncbi:hypothetical protein AAY473_024774 [Plecturocebus cupreus]